MSTTSIHVCPSDALNDGGLAVKIAVQYAGQPGSAFFIRFQGKAYGYLNRCPHAGAELDWEGSVFTRAGDRLMCARHGATFEPDTGRCNGGPCQPSRLIALNVIEERHQNHATVRWQPEGKITPIG